MLNSLGMEDWLRGIQPVGRDGERRLGRDRGSWETRLTRKLDSRREICTSDLRCILTTPSTFAPLPQNLRITIINPDAQVHHVKAGGSEGDRS